MGWKWAGGVFWGEKGEEGSRLGCGLTDGHRLEIQNVSYEIGIALYTKNESTDLITSTTSDIDYGKDWY
jgi:hypothetical protein